jgi:hypothetical protein
MTTTQLFFAIAGLLVGQTGILVVYINAKTEPILRQVDTLVQYMVSHEGKIARLEERTKNLKG